MASLNAFSVDSLTKQPLPLRSTVPALVAQNTAQSSEGANRSLDLSKPVDAL